MQPQLTVIHSYPGIASCASFFLNPGDPGLGSVFQIGWAFAIGIAFAIMYVELYYQDTIYHIVSIADTQ